MNEAHLRDVYWQQLLAAVANRTGGKLEITRQELEAVNLNAQIRIHERQDGITFEVLK